LSPKSLEEIFFNLPNDQILALGFDIDSTNSVRIAREYLAKLEAGLDRDNGKFVLKSLDDFRSIILGLEDDALVLDYEILEARALQKLEKIKDAKEKYLSLCKRYPNEIQPLLYLAEIYLNEENFEKNEELLKQAEAIDSSHWLLALEKLIREYRQGKKIDLTKIDELSFPSDSRIKSNFYRLYSVFLERSGDRKKAESFVERAINLNPEKFANYDVKLSVLEGSIYSQASDRDELKKNLKNYLEEIDTVTTKIFEWDELSPRNQAIINLRKIGAFFYQENSAEVESLAKETISLLLQCYFDELIDRLITKLLMIVSIPQNDFEKLKQYLLNSEKPISKDLAQAIVFQFNIRDNLLSEGKIFFQKTNKTDIINLIDNLENKKIDDVLAFLKNDPKFAVAMANTAKKFPDLRRKIIENLPNDGTIEKEKLLLLLNYDENNTEEAFELLKDFDLSKLSYFECKPILVIAQEKKAWDFVIKIIDKLLQYEKDAKTILQLKLELFNANDSLEKFLEVIKIGEKILSDSQEMALLNDHNREALLGHTLLAYLKRGEYEPAKILLEKHLNIFKNFGFKVAIEADVYLKNKVTDKAIASVVEGVKAIKTPTPEQYGSLFMFFTEVGNLTNFQLVSMQELSVDSFVKLKGQDRWYFLGDGEELDATKISSIDERFAKFLGKKPGDKITFDDKYRSDNPEFIIETIFKIEKYILWQCIHHAEKLSIEHRWDAMEMIEVPTTGETIDTKYIIARLEDERKKRGDFFDLYCRENVPLAFLAVNEGGLSNALGLIINENRGFIRFSTGEQTELDNQKETAKALIAGEPFFIDGTSALVLSETGLLSKIYEYLPSLKVPQSVISLLLEIKEKFNYAPGQVGHMGYTQGQLKFSSVNQTKRELIKSNFEKSIQTLESKPQNIEAISAASKTNCFSEQKVPPELCDACILAQKNDTLLITEDFLYLQANEFETKKKIPKYCSSYALVRVLYEQRKITFDQYLNFFSYLSSYRFRFLPINTDDIAKAIFGEGSISMVNTERISLFNFPLTLSEEYGVAIDKALAVVGRFLVDLLVDGSIPPEIVERIFLEILSTFPATKGKKTLGRMLLRVCVITIRNRVNRGLIIGASTQEKIDRLTQLTEIYNESGFLAL
jgi:hypothetical protein